MKSKKVNLPKQTKSKKGEIINRSFSQISSFRDLSLLLKFDMTASLRSVVLLRLPPMLFYFLQTLLYPSCSNSCSFSFFRSHTHNHLLRILFLLYSSLYFLFSNNTSSTFFLPNFIFTKFTMIRQKQLAS